MSPNLEEENECTNIEELVKAILDYNKICESWKEENSPISFHNLLVEIRNAYEANSINPKHSFLIVFGYEPIDILKTSIIFYFSEKYNIAFSLLRNSFEGYTQAAFLDYIFFNVADRRNTAEILNMIKELKGSKNKYLESFANKIEKLSLINKEWHETMDVFSDYLDLYKENKKFGELPNITNNILLKYSRKFSLFKPIDILKTPLIKDYIRYDFLSKATHENPIFSDTMALDLVGTQDVKEILKNSYLDTIRKVVDVEIVSTLNIIKKDANKNSKTKEKIREIYKEYKELFQELPGSDSKIHEFFK